MSQDISEVLNEFTNNLDALHGSSPLVLGVIGVLSSRMVKAHKEYLEKYGELQSEDNQKEVFNIPIERQSRVRKLRTDSERLIKSSNLIPRNFLVSYVSEFDSFLGSLLKVFHLKKPELLNGSDRSLTFSELLNYDSIQSARDQVLEKEIESVLRKSHSEHFNILEKKFGIPLRKDLDIWPDFIEITERRNLFVHANGVVSTQYLKVCSDHGVEVTDISVGDSLTVDSEYLRKAYKVIFEISVKLAHVLWRKVFPNER